jgi:hypothetical protein
MSPHDAVSKRRQAASNQLPHPSRPHAQALALRIYGIAGIAGIAGISLDRKEHAMGRVFIGMAMSYRFRLDTCRHRASQLPWIR